MSNDLKYDKKTLMELLKIMLSVRDDISTEDKKDILKAMQLILNQSDQDHEDKQEFPITDYKRRN